MPKWNWQKYCEKACGARFKARKWYLENLDKHLANCRRWAALNPAKVAEIRKRFLEKHPGRRAMSSRKSKQANREKVLLRGRLYYYAHRDRARAAYERNAPAVISRSKKWREEHQERYKASWKKSYMRARALRSAELMESITEGVNHVVEPNR